nr:hypothetical protein [uncultured Lachnoanaerobaculum sp.]
MKNRKLSNNEQGIIGIIAVIAFVVGLVFLRDILVKRGVSILMLTREDYMNAVEYYMQKKYGEKFEGEYIVDNSIYVHPKEKPQWHAVVEVYGENGLTYFSDNYVGYLKKAELEKYIYELVKPIYGECKVYTQPYGFSLNDSFNKDTDIITYVSNSDYTISILTDKKADNIEEDFKKTCDTFLDKNLQGDKLYVLYVTKEDLDKFEEYRMDYIFNKCNYYYRISRLYDNVDKTWLDDIDILEGDKDYGK